MASSAQKKIPVTLGDGSPSTGPELWGQWNDWLDQTRGVARPLLEEKKYVLTRALSILEKTDEPILRHKALFVCADCLPEGADSLQEKRLKDLARALLSDPKSNIWEQVGALRICQRLDHPKAAGLELAAVLDTSRAREDGFFLRANLMEHAKQDKAFFEFLQPQLQGLLHDKSAYVRIRALELLSVRGEYTLLLERCEEGDTDPQVQLPLMHCFAELVFAAQADSVKRVEQGLQRFYGQVTVEARSAFLINLNHHLLHHLTQGTAPASTVQGSLGNILRIVRSEAQDVLRRHSSFAQQCVEILRDTRQRNEFLKLHEPLAGQEKFEAAQLPKDRPLTEIAPLLTVLAYFGFGYEVAESPAALTIKPAYGTSWSVWRFVHELKRPSGNKRQGAAHWRSRDLQGTVRFPSSLTCELVATAVPGEPLYISEAGGWRPWLPLLCDVYRMIFRFPVLKIFTPDGVTTVERPRTRFQRMRAWLHLVFQYERVSRLRNWTARHGGDPAAYVKHLVERGFTIRFEPAVADDKDVTVMKFFGSAS